MKLRKKTQPPENEASRRGKMAKRKGGAYERGIARKFKESYGLDLKRTPQSGGFAKNSTLADDFRGDITLVDESKVFRLHVECKNQKSWKLHEWLKQAEGDCPEGKEPVVVFHEHNTSEDYVAMPIKSFFSLVGVGSIVGRRGE